MFCMPKKIQKSQDLPSKMFTFTKIHQKFSVLIFLTKNAQRPKVLILPTQNACFCFSPFFFSLSLYNSSLKNQNIAYGAGKNMPWWIFLKIHLWFFGLGNISIFQLCAFCSIGVPFLFHIHKTTKVPWLISLRNSKHKKFTNIFTNNIH